MKHEPKPKQASLTDGYVFERVVPQDHPLVQIDGKVNFSFIHEVVEGLYSAKLGRRAVDPELLLRLSFLQVYYGLSDREVIGRAQTDLAFRKFLHVGLEEELPHPTTLTVFRRRVGAERFREVFNRSVAMAVEEGVIAGKLLLVDSFGLVGDVAIPRLRRLLQRLTRRGLRALRGWGLRQGRLEEEWNALRRDESWWISAQLGEKALVGWFALAEEVLGALGSAPLRPEQEEEGKRLSELLGKAIQRQSKPRKGERGDRIVSDVDGDVRWSSRERGKRTFAGYRQQIATDEESEIITAACVTPANRDDKERLGELVEQHKANVGGAPGGVAGDSGYSSGANRAKLREEGIEDYLAVPTPKGHKQGRLSASDFTVEWQGEIPLRLRCPRGEVAEGGRWDEDKRGWQFYFTVEQCRDCPWREQCTRSGGGRSVFLTEHCRINEESRARQSDPDFLRAQEKRLGIERTFAYQQRRSNHGRARYRGLERVGIQVFMTCFMVNVVRLTRCLRKRHCLDPAWT